MKPTALGSNIFAGGFSLGVSRHFRLLGHLEHDDGYGAEVARRNLGVQIWVGKDEWPADTFNKIDFLYSNPPCAIWSVAGARLGGVERNWKTDPRLQRIRDIFGLVERYRPPVWCWESVCQAFSKGREFVEELAGEAEKLGYSASYVLVDAQYLGVPQVRKRFFLVLHNISIDWEKARPDFSRTISAGDALKGVKPVKELLGKPTPGEMKMLGVAKPGERLSRVYDRTIRRPRIGSRGQKLGRPSFLKHRLDPTRPSNTVIGNAIFHPREKRFLAVNECAALSGYPQSWKWPRSDGHNLLARGVMPPVGEWLAKQVARALRKRRRIMKPRRWLVDFRQAPGSIHDVAELPESVDLDWSPKTLQPAGRLPPRAGSPPRAGGGRLKARTGRPQAGRPRAGRRGLELGELAEATRKGIPDRKGRVLIRQALEGLRRGQFPAGSGMLIRARLVEKKLADHEIIEEVLRKYKGRKTTQADIAWHRHRMRLAGIDV